MKRYVCEHLDNLGEDIPFRQYFRKVLLAIKMMK